MTQVTATRGARGTGSMPRLASVAPLGLFNAVGKATVLVFLTVVVIVGILAMHSFASPASHADMWMPAEGSTTVVASHHAADSASVASVASVAPVAPVASAPDCLGCGDDNTMVLMWCVFALLSVTLLLTAPKLVNGRVRAALRLFSVLPSDPPNVGLFTRAPSLTTLCISRT